MENPTETAASMDGDYQAGRTRAGVDTQTAAEFPCAPTLTVRSPDLHRVILRMVPRDDAWEAPGSDER